MPAGGAGGKGPGRGWNPFGTLVKLALIAAAVGLAAAAFAGLSREAQQVFVTAFCVVGLVGTVVMLFILVRQSGGKR
jgi:hypothetical protein